MNSPGVKNKKFFVYILRTSAGTLYIGQTNDMDRRLKEHRDKKGRGSKYMRYFGGAELVYSESYLTRSEAIRREIELKKWPKSKKEALIRK